VFAQDLQLLSLANFLLVLAGLDVAVILQFTWDRVVQPEKRI
jgi:hypothetical protein